MVDKKAIFRACGKHCVLHRVSCCRSQHDAADRSLGRLEVFSGNVRWLRRRSRCSCSTAPARSCSLRRLSREGGGSGHVSGDAQLMDSGSARRAA